MCLTRLSFATAVFIFLVHERLVNGDITTQPMSASVPLGDIALFTCAGDGLGAFWTVNGLSDAVQENKDRGVVISEGGSGTRYESNLTIPATEENNNVSIQCFLTGFTPPDSFTTDPSPIVYLTVLGVGAITSVSLPSISCIQWEEPVFRSADVTDLMYSVIVGGANLPSLNITTNETKYCPEPELSPCQEYTVTVTPFSTSPDYTGTGYTVMDTIPGENYTFEGQCSSEVMFEFNSTNISCTFKCQLQVPSAVCPGQSVQVVTGSYLNDDNVMTHPLLPIDSSAIYDVKFIDITVSGLPAGEPCYSDISLISKDNVSVSETSQNFTTYSVQDAMVTNLPVTTEVCVECVFAVNAPAQGCFVLFSSSSLVIFNVTIFRTASSSTASACTPVPDSLPLQTVQEFVVTVYDYQGDTDPNLSEPAVTLPQLLQVEPVTEEPTVESSSSLPEPSLPVVVSNTLSGQDSSSSSPSPSVVPVASGGLASEVIVSIVVVSVIIIALGIILIPVAVIAFKRRLYSKFNGDSMGFISPRSNSPRLVEVVEIDGGNAREPSIGQEIKAPVDTSQPPPTYPAPRSAASSSNPPTRNPLYDDLAKFSSKPKSGAASQLQYADLGPRSDGGPVHRSEQDRVKYTSIQHPPKKVEYAVLQKPPRKRPPVKHDAERVTYVKIRPEDQPRVHTTAGASQPDILTALDSHMNQEVGRHYHSQPDFSASAISSVGPVASAIYQDLELFPSVLDPPKEFADSFDHAGGPTKSPPPSWEEVTAQDTAASKQPLPSWEELAGQEVEMTDFVSGRDGDTIPRDTTHSDQLRGKPVHACTWIPLTSSVLPFHSMGEDHSDQALHLSEKTYDDEFDLSLSCQSCSEVDVSEPSQCVDVSSSSMVLPGQSTRSFLSAYKYAYGCYNVTRSLPSKRTNQSVVGLVSSTYNSSGLCSASALDESKAIPN